MNTATTTSSDATFCSVIFTTTVLEGHAPSLAFRAAAASLLAVRGALTMQSPIIAADKGVAAMKGVPVDQRWTVFAAAVLDFEH